MRPASAVAKASVQGLTLCSRQVAGPVRVTAAGTAASIASAKISQRAAEGAGGTGHRRRGGIEHVEVGLVAQLDAGQVRPQALGGPGRLVGHRGRGRADEGRAVEDGPVDLDGEGGQAVEVGRRHRAEHAAGPSRGPGGAFHRVAAQAQHPGTEQAQQRHQRGVVGREQRQGQRGLLEAEAQRPAGEGADDPAGVHGQAGGGRGAGRGHRRHRSARAGGHPGRGGAEPESHAGGQDVASAQLRPPWHPGSFARRVPRTGVAGVTPGRAAPAPGPAFHRPDRSNRRGGSAAWP